MMAITTVVFDAYGTLFDVAGAARAVAFEPGQRRLAAAWQRFSDDWRRKQLEYTWLRTIADRYIDFAQVTADSLDWALQAHGLQEQGLRDRLLTVYDRLPAYPEVEATLRSLHKAGYATAILSNGTPAMLASAVSAAGIDNHLDAILSVDAVATYKPSARVYDLVPQRFGCAPQQVLFVSSNGWDVAGAAGFGFATVWVNRAGLPEDRLADRPAYVLSDLMKIPSLAASL
jgi:2-haloacid dehalogenase